MNCGDPPAAPHTLTEPRYEKRYIQMLDSTTILGTDMELLDYALCMYGEKHAVAACKQELIEYLLSPNILAKEMLGVRYLEVRHWMRLKMVLPYTG